MVVKHTTIIMINLSSLLLIFLGHNQNRYLLTSIR
nr:MAG TPA: hypothetical protein [Caudoviricetes sp.]